MKGDIMYYYYAKVNYREPGMAYNAGYSVASETMEQARDELAYGVNYYQTLDDTQIVTAKIDKVCDTCNGEGQVRRGKRVIKQVRCPDCKGKDSRSTVETWIDLPKETWV